MSTPIERLRDAARVAIDEAKSLIFYLHNAISAAERRKE